jgi:hypothetical protein
LFVYKSTTDERFLAPAESFFLLVRVFEEIFLIRVKFVNAISVVIKRKAALQAAAQPGGMAEYGKIARQHSSWAVLL